MGRLIPLLLVLLVTAGEIAIADDDVPRGVAAAPWAGGLGNHRARVSVTESAGAVWASVPWRRRDSDPDHKDVIVMDARTGKRVVNVMAVAVGRERGELLFEPPTAPGDYFIYYMPYRYQGSPYSPTTVYLPPENHADAEWVKKYQPLAKQIISGMTRDIPRAKVNEIQAISEFDRFDPMEVIATTEETKRLITEHPNEPYLLFPEDRRFPIRMTDDLPLRWIHAGPSEAFRGDAFRNEFFAMQIGLFASVADVREVSVEFNDLKSQSGRMIAASALRCINTGGTDWLGRRFTKTVNVPRGKVQALWFGVSVPPDAVAGLYTGNITIHPKDLPPKTVALSLNVSQKLLEDSGDSDISSQSRLRWLDSTIGLDDENVAPYPPVTLNDRTVGILGRRARFNDAGLLDSIQSTFSSSVDGTDAPARELLAGPVQFVAGNNTWTGSVKVVDQKSGAVSWEATSGSGALEFHSHAKMECDGYVNFKLTLKAREAMDLGDIHLDIPLQRDVCKYMMGMGYKGGLRAKDWKWKWDVNRANNMLWIGDVNAGLSFKLKEIEDRWDLYNLRQSGTYRDWSNDGKGGCNVGEDGERVLIRAYTGARHISAGEELHFNFGLLITPVKVLDKNHWNWRYHHQSVAASVPDIAKTGANIVNIHQGDPLNPNINYPFVSEKLPAYIQDAHARGIKVKIYYTVRELSNYAGEIFPLRSLGNEVFLDGPGFQLADQFLEKKSGANSAGGNSWLCEHIATHYVPAWHTPLGNGKYDASLATNGLSRWHNYYLQGLDWLIRKEGVDGLYLDGVGYDREIMKRVHKVMDRARPGCLIDMHSGNNFEPAYGLNSPANQFMELFPYLDSVWFGEGYNYNESPDYWLVEISGIPQGLFGEMLQGGGNRWRGMLYGMTARFGWSGDPRPLWKLWDDFGIQNARMIGYWDPACPIKTDNAKVLATVYKKNGRALVAIASWAKEKVDCHLAVDWKSLGLDPKKTHFFAPSISGFQPGGQFDPTEAIPVAPGKGWLVILDETGHDSAIEHLIAKAYENRKQLLEDRFDRDSLGTDWKTSLSTNPGSSLKVADGALAVGASANCFAFAERELPSGCTLAECMIFSGTDHGATWGPGMALTWKDKALRINLRAEGRFGVNDGASETFDGVVSPNKWYHLRIRIESDEVIAESSADGKFWLPIRIIPRSEFQGDPIVVRLGKMNSSSQGSDHPDAGPAGSCAFKDFKAYGKKPAG